MNHHLSSSNSEKQINSMQVSIAVALLREGKQQGQNDAIGRGGALLDYKKLISFSKFKQTRSRSDFIQLQFCICYVLEEMSIPTSKDPGPTMFL